jgi:hypothetical protein
VRDHVWVVSRVQPCDVLASAVTQK